MKKGSAFYIRKRLSKLLNLTPSSYGKCYRCNLRWNVVNGHSTMYNENTGCFPLCEHCWAELTPIERLPYYKELYNDWDNPKDDWEEIEKAVLMEL